MLEHLPAVLKALADYGISPVMLILIAMLYFMGAHSGIFPKFWGAQREDEEKESVPAWAQKIMEYYNHDTTEHHNETHKKLDSLIALNGEHVKNTLEHQSRVRENFRELKASLDTIKEYGVPLRGSK